MCGGGGSSAASDAALKKSQAQQAQHEADIAAGKASIDKAFSGFDQPYYDNYSKSIENYQLPQLDQQYAGAKATDTANLAQRGMLESSSGAGALGKLYQDYLTQQGQVKNSAVDMANKLKGTIENQKSNLYALNQSAADPSSIAAQATGTATAIKAPSAVSPLGTVLSAAIAPVGAYNQGMYSFYPQHYQTHAPVASGAGSSRNVGG